MKISELEVGRVYRLYVKSELGYEDYCYTGDTLPSPEGGLNYCFEMMDGYYWFDEKEIELMIPTNQRDWRMAFEKNQDAWNFAKKCNKKENK